MNLFKANPDIGSQIPESVVHHFEVQRAADVHGSGSVTATAQTRDGNP